MYPSSSQFVLVVIMLGILLVSIVLIVIWVVTLDRRMRGVVDGLESERRKIAEMQIAMGRRMTQRGYGQNRSARRPPQRPMQPHARAGEEMPAEARDANTGTQASASVQAQTARAAQMSRSAQGVRPAQSAVASQQAGRTAQGNNAARHPSAVAQARIQRAPSEQVQRAVSSTKRGFDNASAQMRSNAAEAQRRRDDSTPEAQARRAAERQARQARIAARRQAREQFAAQQAQMAAETMQREAAESKPQTPSSSEVSDMFEAVNVAMKAKEPAVTSSKSGGGRSRPRHAR